MKNDPGLHHLKQRRKPGHQVPNGHIQHSFARFQIHQRIFVAIARKLDHIYFILQSSFLVRLPHKDVM